MVALALSVSYGLEVVLSFLPSGRTEQASIPLHDLVFSAQASCPGLQMDILDEFIDVAMVLPCSAIEGAIMACGQRLRVVSFHKLKADSAEPAMVASESVVDPQ